MSRLWCGNPSPLVAGRTTRTEIIRTPPPSTMRISRSFGTNSAIRKVRQNAMSSGLLLDHPAISNLTFYVNGHAIPSPVMVASDGADLACSYHEIDPGGSTVIFFHGNGESVSDYYSLLPRAFG